MVSGESLQGYLDALASGDTTPGGGSASAVAAAIGAALLSMACSATIGRKKYREHEQLLMSSREEADALRELAISLSSEDAAAYTAVDEARALPRDTSERATTRTSRIQKALEGATDVPLRTAEVSARVLHLCAPIAEVVNIHAASDLGVGAMLARSGLDGAAMSVETNLTLIKDPEYREAASARLRRILDSARPRFDETMRSVRHRAVT